MIAIRDLASGDIVVTRVHAPWYVAVVVKCNDDHVVLSGRDITVDDSKPELFQATEEEIVPLQFRNSPLKAMLHTPGKLIDSITIGDKVITASQREGGPMYVFVCEDKGTKEKIVTGGQGIHDFFRCLRKGGLEEEVKRYSEMLVEKYKLR